MSGYESPMSATALDALATTRSALHTLAEQLDVPRKAADAILFDVLAEHLQVQAVEGGPIPKLGGRRSTPP